MRRTSLQLLAVALALTAASFSLGCEQAAFPKTSGRAVTSATEETRPETWLPEAKQPEAQRPEARRPESQAPQTEQREAWQLPYLKTLEELGRMVRSGFFRGDVNLGVFGTHVDWHSSVHAHWALLRVAAITHDTALKDLVVKRLRPGDIAREQARLERHETFEMPYGRAWLLRLIIEYEDVTGDDLMRPFGDGVARSLLAYLSGRSDQAGLTEYANLEWATTALFDYGRATGNEALRESARTFAQSLLAAGDGYDWSVDLASDVGFFSPAGNTALMIDTMISPDQGREYLDRLAAAAVIAVDAPPARSSSHSAGLFFSRAWGLKAMYSLTGDEAFEAAYYRHMDLGLAELERRNPDFEGVGHWVPQFAIFALTFGE